MSTFGEAQCQRAGGIRMGMGGDTRTVPQRVGSAHILPATVVMSLSNPKPQMNEAAPEESANDICKFPQIREPESFSNRQRRGEEKHAHKWAEGVDNSTYR